MTPETAAWQLLEACEPFVDGAPDSPPEVRQLGHACEVLKDALGRASASSPWARDAEAMRSDWPIPTNGGRDGS